MCLSARAFPVRGKHHTRLRQLGRGLEEEECGGMYDHGEMEEARCVQREAKQAQLDWMSRFGGTCASLCTPRW